MTPAIDLPKFPSLDFEQSLWESGFARVAGIDEAGRGAWAGPVYAAAVILPTDPSLPRILNRVRDSKLMTPAEREAWAPRIREIAQAWGVGSASAEEIDALGIVRATKLAATRALACFASFPSSSPYPLSPSFPSSVLPPDYLLTDYLLFPNLDIPQTALVKGDRRSLSVAAASVLAKTARDAHMRELDGNYPGYGFARHKGYGTQIHQHALRTLGACEIHRKSFAILSSQ